MLNIHSALVFVLFLKKKSNCRELDPLGLLLHEKMEKHRQRYHCQTSKQISVNKTHMLKPLKRRGTHSNSSRHTTGKWFKILEMVQVIFKLNNLFVSLRPTQTKIQIRTVFAFAANTPSTPCRSLHSCRSQHNHNHCVNTHPCIFP